MAIPIPQSFVTDSVNDELTQVTHPALSTVDHHGYQMDWLPFNAARSIDGPRNNPTFHPPRHQSELIFARFHRTESFIRKNSPSSQSLNWFSGFQPIVFQ
jgi:hypothetical protein